MEGGWWWLSEIRMRGGNEKIDLHQFGNPHGRDDVQWPHCAAGMVMA